MGRIFVLDPGFGSLLGHRFVANSVLASGLGCPVSILAAAKLPAEVTIANATIERHFQVPLNNAGARRRAANGASRDGFWRGLRDLARHWMSGNWRGDVYQADLARFFADRQVDRSDHLIVHSAGDLFVQPLADLLSTRPPETMPTLHVRLLGVRNDWLEDPPDLGPMRQLIAARRAFLYAEMEMVADAVRAALGVDDIGMLRLALPMTGAIPDRVGRLRDGRKFQVLYFGNLRDEKGWQRIPAIARLLARADADGFRIVMHVGNPWTLARRRHRAARKAVNGADVALLQGHLTNDELSRLLSEADVVVMPYSARSYGLRGSGVGLDSIAHGVPLVVTAGCCLTEFVAGGNGLAAGSDAEFAKAIVRIRNDYLSFVEKAEQARWASAGWVRDSVLARRIMGEMV